MKSPAPTRSSRSNSFRSQPLALSDYVGVPFHANVGELHDFFILAGTSSATLVGLLFVGLSLHLRIVIAASEVRSLPGTLANFGAVLFVTLFMVIYKSAESAAIQLIGTGIVSVIVTTPSVVALARGRDAYWEMRLRDRVRMILRFGLSGIGYLGIIAAGALLLLAHTSAFVWVIVAAIVLLLLISLRNTWDLLVTVGEQTMAAEQDKS